MAFMLLFSTLSFTVDKHFCGETLVDFAFFHDAETCGMENVDSSNKDLSSEDCNFKKKNCCSDEQTLIEGIDDLTQTPSKISFEQTVFIASYILSTQQLFDIVNKENSSFKDYSPPPFIRKIYKLDEVYLI